MGMPRPKPPRSKIVQAAGAVIWRLSEDAQTFAGTRCPKTQDDVEVLIVHRPKYNDWSWPKGKREFGESLLETATREVEEETGIAVRLQAPLTTQRYRLGSHTTKAVYYWLGKAELDDAALRARRPAHRASKREIDETRWVNPEEALRLLTRRGDKRLLEEVLVKLESGTLDTVPLAIVRHGKAMSRKKWGESEATRPLEREGVYEVRQLTGLFSAYGVSDFVTSPWRRCLATVGTYASLTGANVEVVPEASEDAFAEDPEAFRKIVKRLMRIGKARPTALCVHRPTLPVVFEEVTKRTPTVIARQIPDEDPYLRTAEMLICHIAMVPDALAGRAEEMERERREALRGRREKRKEDMESGKLSAVKQEEDSEKGSKKKRKRRFKGALKDVKLPQDTSADLRGKDDSSASDTSTQDSEVSEKSKKKTVVVTPAMLAARARGVVASGSARVDNGQYNLDKADSEAAAKADAADAKTARAETASDAGQSAQQDGQSRSKSRFAVPKPGPQVTARIVSIERVRPIVGV